LPSLPLSLLQSKPFFLQLVSLFGCSLAYAPSSLQNDKEIVLAAIKNQWISLEFAGELMKND
jgi:hypothetical protein